MAYIRKRKASLPMSASDGVGDSCVGLEEDNRDGPALSNEWLWFSDLCCGPVSSQQVAEAEPYICFYERA